MYGIRAIILGLVAGASLVQGVEQGVYSVSTSTSTPTSTPNVTVRAVVTPAPTTTSEFEWPGWTTSWDRWTTAVHDNERRDTTPGTMTKLVEPALGPFFSSLISRLRDLERHATGSAERPDAKPTTTKTRPWDFSLSVMETETEWVSLPTISVSLNGNAQPTPAAPLGKNAGNRIVSSRVKGLTNQSATSTGASRPTKVPPSSGAVAAAAPVMGAVAVFIAGCVLVL